jgi:hypothetical protein
MTNIEEAYLCTDVRVNTREIISKTIIKFNQDRLKKIPLWEKGLNYFFNYKSKKTKYWELQVEEHTQKLSFLEKNRNKIFLSIFFEKLHSLEDKRNITDGIYNLDDILEKISSNGIDSLTDNEINFLKNYSDTI